VRDLRGRLSTLLAVCEPMGLGVIACGTHPFADWRDSALSDGERYQRLVNAMQWPARRLLISGTHVHVGVASGEHAVAITNSLAIFTPHLLALSASSPFWQGFDTGLASCRAKIFEGLPTAGMPPRLANYSEFTQLMRTLKTAGAISTIREVWWDVRPHSGFGTVELRIMDGINTSAELRAAAAFAHALVEHLHDLYDRGEPLPTLRTWTRRENKWRAIRFGESAKLIRNEKGAEVMLADHVREWRDKLGPAAARVGCTGELASIEASLGRGAGYQRQRELYAATGTFVGVIDGLERELREDAPL
jgi:carboxylate-amine ligase